MSNAASTTCLPPTVASKLQDAIVSLRSGISYQQEEMAAFLEKLLAPTTTPPPATPTPLANPTTADETPGMPTDRGSGTERDSEISEMDDTVGVYAWSGPDTGAEAPTPWHEAEETTTPWHTGLTAVGKTCAP
eukprot:576629-Heterocapsa_arctica.AAC.1